MKMKKVMAYVCALSMMTAVLPQNIVSDLNICGEQKVLAAMDDSGLEYEELEDGTVEITGYSGEDTVVVIPDEIDGKKVTSIGCKAFEKCSGLTEITIPESVTSIGNWAFYVCSDLTEITIPESVTSIGYDAFSETSWLENKRLDNPLVVVNGILIDGETCKGSVVVPEGVTSIGEGAFNGCSELTEIFIPRSVTSIGISAFFGCSGLTEITIPEGVKSIREGTFSECKNLTEITLPEGVTSIGNSAFSGCSSLTEITIPESVTSIGNLAFGEVSEEFKIYGAEGSYAQEYANDNNLIFIAADENGFEYKGLKDGTLEITGYSGEDTVLVIPDEINGKRVTRIGECAFSNCNITKITIPEGVINISDRAFDWCESLTEITLPEGLINIGDRAFDWCESLTEITLPEGLTNIGDRAFYRCSSLKEITVPQSVKKIGDHAFNGTPWLDNKRLSDSMVVISGILIDGKECNGSVVIPESVTSIGNYAFYQCSDITEITIPEGVTSIEKSAFDGCTGLTEITIPKGVTSIGDWAFSKCSGITEMTIPEGVTSIGDWAFYECSDLTKVTIPEGVTSIGYKAFGGCSDITEITIPESVTSIGDWAFSKCSGITEMTIPEGVTSIGDWAFYKCSDLTKVTIPEGVTSIGYKAFGGCSDITEITIPESVTSIGIDAFSDVSEDFKIYGAEGSYTQKYADDNNLKFEIISESDLSDSVIGDINDDGIVSAADFVRLVQYILNSEIQINLKNSDMNSDGKIDSTDVVEHKKLLCVSAQTNSEDDPVENPEKTDWESLYRNKLNDYYSYSKPWNIKYTLCDINSDGIPELVVSVFSSFAESRCDIYTIYDGELSYLGPFGSWGYCGCDKENGIIRSSVTHSGTYMDEYCKIESGKAVKLIEYKYCLLYENETTNIYYEIDGEEVSSDEYNSKDSEYSNRYNISKLEGENELSVDISSLTW